MSLKKTLLTVGCLLAATRPAEAEPIPLQKREPLELTLAVALELGQKHNPVVAAARERVQSARLDHAGQQLWWARAMRANVNIGTVGAGTPMLMTEGTLLPMAAVGLNINLGEVLTAPHNIARAEHTIHILEAEERRIQLETRDAIAQAYFDYVAAKRLEVLSDATIATADTDVKISERQFARGLSGINLVSQARLNARRARGDATLASVQVAKAWSRLVNLLGAPELLSSAPAVINAHWEH